MSEDLTISGAGSMAIATDDVFTIAQQLGELCRESMALQGQLRATASLCTESFPRTAGSMAAKWADQEMERAGLLLSQLEWESRTINGTLVAVAEGYGFAEFAAERVLRGVAGALARVAEDAVVAAVIEFPIIAVGVTGLVVGINSAGGMGAILKKFPAAQPNSPLSRFMRQNNEVITNPAVVSLVRLASQSTSGVAMSRAGAAGPIASRLGGPSSFEMEARTITASGRTIGLFEETPVRLESEHPLTTGAAPRGFADRLDRVPDPETNGGAQVVVEKYSMPDGTDRFEVYIAGTVTFSPASENEPFDMTSNMGNAAGQSSAAVRSVAEAMRLAGVDANSPVQFTGYSQGGGTAAQLAASGDYHTCGVLSFGGPTGQVDLPDGVNAVLVEHTDDIVPALGGEQDNRFALIVQRDVFGGVDIPADYAVPAHHLDAYAQTARLMDEAKSDQVVRSAQKMDSFSHGATTVTSTAYRFERVNPAAP